MVDKIRIQKALASYKKELEDLGYNVVYVALYGSQNYNLSDEGSDIDARAVVVPTLKQLVKREKISFTHESGGSLVDVKDVESFVLSLAKGNPAFTECAQTEYFVGDKEFRRLISTFETKAMAIYAIALEKFKAIEKGLPVANVKECGYDPKQLHHIMRAELLLDKIIETGEVIPCIFYDEDDEARSLLMEVKRGETKLLEKDHIVEKLKPMFIEKYRKEMDKFPLDTQEIPDEIYTYIEKKVADGLFKTDGERAARNVRTFGQGIPKKDMEDFPFLKEHKGHDISYTVYSFIEFLGDFDKKESE